MDTHEKKFLQYFKSNRGIAKIIWIITFFLLLSLCWGTYQDFKIVHYGEPAKGIVRHIQAHNSYRTSSVTVTFQINEPTGTHITQQKIHAVSLLGPFSIGEPVQLKKFGGHYKLNNYYETYFGLLLISGIVLFSAFITFILIKGERLLKSQSAV